MLLSLLFLIGVALYTVNIDMNPIDFLRGKLTLEKLVRDAPILFIIIGIAIGMVLMVILFQYYEDAIKSWGGYSRLAFPLLAVYMTLAWIHARVFRRKLSEMLGE